MSFTAASSFVASPMPSLPTTPQAAFSTNGVRPPALPMFSTPRHVPVPSSCQHSPLYSTSRRPFTFEQEGMMEHRLGDSLASVGCLSMTPQGRDNQRLTIQDLTPVPPRASAGGQTFDRVAALETSGGLDENAMLRFLSAHKMDATTCSSVSPQTVVVGDESSPSSPSSAFRNHSTTWGAAFDQASPIGTCFPLSSSSNLANVVLFNPGVGYLHAADEDEVATTAPPGSSADASTTTDAGSVFSDRRSLLYYQHHNLSGSQLHSMAALASGTISGSPMPPGNKGVLQPPLPTPQWAAACSRPPCCSADVSPATGCVAPGFAALVLDPMPTAVGGTAATSALRP